MGCVKSNIKICQKMACCITHTWWIDKLHQNKNGSYYNLNYYHNCIDLHKHIHYQNIRVKTEDCILNVSLICRNFTLFDPFFLSFKNDVRKSLMTKIYNFLPPLKTVGVIHTTTSKEFAIKYLKSNYLIWDFDDLNKVRNYIQTKIIKKVGVIFKPVLSTQSEWRAEL